MPASVPNGITRAERNDARIASAIETVLVDMGSAALTLRNVALAAGVARQTVAERHPSGTDMAVTAWQRFCGAPLRAALHAVVTAHLPASGRPDPDVVAAAWRALALPDRPLRGATELLLASPFLPPLRAVIDADLGAEVRRATGLDQGGTRATQSAYLIARALGLLVFGSILDLADVDGTASHTALIAALARPAPPDSIAHLTLRASPIATGDAQLDAVFQSTLRQIGAYGYDAASVDRIAHEAGLTKGFVFGRYPNKERLFVAAARERLRSAAEDVQRAIAVVAESHGLANAEAAFVRAAMAPEQAAVRRIVSEEFRLALHSPEIAAEYRAIADRVAATLGVVDPRTLGYAHLARAFGEGIGLLALLAPEAWTLPYEVVLVPLQDTLVAEFLPERPR
jgi:AcrR family transcriptional regulator